MSGARQMPCCSKKASTTRSSLASAPVCDCAAWRPASERPDFSAMIGRSRVERHGSEFLQIFRFGNALEVKQQQLDLGVLGDRDREFADRDIGIVAGGVRMAHADAALTQESDRHRRQRAALAEHRDVAFRAIHIHEHGGEAGDRAGAEIGEPLRIGTDDAHAGLVRGLDHPPFLGLAGHCVDLAEARRHHDRDLDAVRGAIFHRYRWRCRPRPPRSPSQALPADRSRLL